MSTIQTGILTPEGFRFTTTIACTLGEAVQYEPGGVYTITRTYDRDKALLLDSHLDRLEESARLEQIPLELDRDALRDALRSMIERSGYSESRFRVTVPRENPQQVYLAMEPLKPVSPELRQNGVSVQTISVQRHNPSAKTTAWMTRREEATATLPTNIYEAVLVGAQGELLEGSSSNFYAVLDGVLRTAEEGILHGISRKALLSCVGDVVPVERQPITYDDIPHLSEAFLTSSSRGVIPIIEIDGQKIGDGQPGKITLELQQRYDAWTEANLEPI